MANIVCACGKTVETQAEWAGQWISCPGCGGSLYSPHPGPKPSAPSVGAPADFDEFPPLIPASAPTRICPMCAETIPAAEASCRFCSGRPAPARPRAETPPVDDGGVAALIVGIIGFMFCQLLSPVAWIIGANYEAECRARNVAPSSAGHAGKIIGIVGSIFLAIAVLFFLLSVVAQAL